MNIIVIYPAFFDDLINLDSETILRIEDVEKYIYSSNGFLLC